MTAAEVIAALAALPPDMPVLYDDGEWGPILVESVEMTQVRRGRHPNVELVPGIVLS